MNIKTNKPYTKSVLALILASILIGSTIVGIASAFQSGQSAVSPFLADFVHLQGVAANDYYDSRQHSYNVNWWGVNTIPGYPTLSPANMWFNASKSLRWGMTEFGEFATPANNGIAYGGSTAEWGNTESWANTAINPALYIQGWTFFMNYTRAGTYRAIEAYALFSDLMAVETGRKVYSWYDRSATGVHYTPSQAGAVLTAGSLSASGVQILYDSARLVVARATTTIRDGFYNEDVAKITFTVVLNKDTKYAIVYKDVKILIDPKVLDLIDELIFTERYEIDLARGVNPSNQAFIHWFEDYNTTVYTHPLVGNATYDVLQAFDPLRKYIFFAGYWPECTEYAVYHPLVPDIPRDILQNLLPGQKVADIPSPQNEPNTPWVIAQWRYNTAQYPKMLQFLAKAANREIRFVEVAGMTDYNVGNTVYNSPNTEYNAKDINATDTFNSVDTEVRYFLNNVFNPEDLRTVDSTPFMWVGLGQSAATTDSAGAAALADFGQWSQQETLGLFDRNDTAFPWTAPVIGMKGTIPFALDNDGNFAPNYLETFSNSGKGTGTDTTNYSRTGLNGFVFNYYDAATSGRSPPQPIAGGQSMSGTGYTSYWYPSRDPLYSRWAGTPSFSPMLPYMTWAAPNGIISLGGMKANGITRYFNDFNFAISREGVASTYYALVNGGSVTGTAPTSDATKLTLDYFPISTWASSQSTFAYKEGYAVISVARDINGTRGFSVYGWDGRDTYWAAAWASQYCGSFSSWIPAGTVAIVLNITYSAADREPTAFTIVKALGTITEFGNNAFITQYLDFDWPAFNWAPASTVVPPAVPAYMVESTIYSAEWWYAKLPTTSTAKVDYDP